MREALTDYDTYHIPAVNVAEAYEDMKRHWSVLRAQIKEQTPEFNLRNYELFDDVSTASHLLQMAFENAQKEEEAILLQENKHAIEEQLPMKEEGAVGGQLPTKNEPMVTEPSEKQPTERVVVKTPMQLGSSASTASAHSSALSGHTPMQVDYDNKKYSIGSLNQVKYVLYELQNLPKIPERPDQSHFAKLRDAITSVVKHIEEAQCSPSQFAPIILATVPNALNSTTRIMWEFEVTLKPVTLPILREFLASQQEVRISGWRPETEFRALSTKVTGDNSPTGTLSKRMKVAKNQNGSGQPAVHQSQKKCYLCDGQHFLFRCSHFLGKTLPSRWQFISQANVCPNCLRGLHTAAQCESGGCKKCPGQKHNSVMCEQNPQS